MRSLLLLLVAVPAFADPSDNLDRAAISDGVAKVKSKVIACGSSSRATGTVKIKVEVAPSGSVNNATVSEAPEPALGDCVAAIMKSAVFRATKNGGSFSYPFVFGSGQPPAADPETIDRAAISEGVAKIKPQVMACASKVRGTVKIKVDVAPAGTVSAATVMATPDQALGECVAAAFRRATFRKTVKGGTFSYPFVF